MDNPKNIIVRMPNWIGDAVMAMPVLADLRHQFPKAKISALCQGGAGELLKHDPRVDEVISFKKPSGFIAHIKRSPLIENLKKGNYDTGLLLTNSFSSAWMFFRGGVSNRIGFSKNLRSWLLNAPIPFPKNMETTHLTQTYKKLLSPLGIKPSGTKPDLIVSASEKAEAKKFLEHLGVPDDAILVGVNPGAAYGSAKCWLPDRFHDTAKELLKDPKVWILFFGDQKGRPLTEEVSQDLGDRVINLAGKTTLRELVVYISCLNVLLSNDSGPMHIASALSVPVVALFGSTNDTKTGPINRSIVIHKHVECSPCYKRECPIDFRCMTKIHTDEVVQAIRRLLDVER
ncbi:MAG: lipopolysaccharide heptosyltransferase II [Chlamydiia bacterium]|nr:lipopolysaccharide heptosyltransferase II [Chlamydiia bacterium]